MRIGTNLINRGALARPEVMTRFVQRAEALGFESVTMSDHIVVPRDMPDNYPYHPEGKFSWEAARDYYEPLATLMYLAGKTERIRLGTSVLIISYRNPVTVAKMMSTIDALSGGRTFLGVGAGWWADEYRALGIGDHFAERGPRTDEYIRIYRTLWNEENPAFQGRFHQFSNIEFSPKPAQKGGIPVWVGGHTTRALRRAAELGDAWHPIGLRPPAGLQPEELKARREQLFGLMTERGRDPGAMQVCFRAPVVPGGQGERLRGPADKIVEDVKAYEAAGVQHLTCDIVAGSEQELFEQLDRIGQEILPQVR